MRKLIRIHFVLCFNLYIITVNSFLPKLSKISSSFRLKRKVQENYHHHLSSSNNSRDNYSTQSENTDFNIYPKSEPTLNQNSLVYTRTAPKDIVIIGGGIAGLSIAHALKTKYSNLKQSITILEQSSPEIQTSNGCASFAAAGMLAPQSERLTLGPYLDLCHSSRLMYTDFVSSIESICNQRKKSIFSFPEEQYSGVGYSSRGGFIAPAFAGDSIATWAPPEGYGSAQWLDAIQIRELEPELHPDVVGGWWFSDDKSVDAQKLTCSLRVACEALGVQMCFGEDYAVQGLDFEQGKCSSVQLKNGEWINADVVVIANGSWMRKLLPVPVVPHKGQSLSLRMPSSLEFELSRVLFAQDTYIVPKADGRIIIGATVEPNTFDTSVTAGGMMHILKSAMGLVPELANGIIENSWAGLRPTTSDKLPLLGKSQRWENLIIAGGYWRNGILLAPKTAQLIADCIYESLSDEDEILLNHFSWDRFMEKEGGANLALETRYAASMHPLQYYQKSKTSHEYNELGAYSDATAAKEERERDRKALFESSPDAEKRLEEAALAGIQDGQAFIFDKKENEITDTLSTTTATTKEPLQLSPASTTTVTDITLSSSSTLQEEQHKTSTTSSSELESIYETIKSNKAKKQSALSVATSSQDNNDKRESDTNTKQFDFKIYHVDPVTREQRYVKPGTTEQELFQQIAIEKQQLFSSSSSLDDLEYQTFTVEPNNVDEPNEKTFDGYVDIQDANGAEDRKGELEKMKRARMRNRHEFVDEGEIGVKPDDL